MARRKVKRNHELAMTVNDLDKIRLKATVEAVQITQYFPLLILRAKHGFAELRLRRFQGHYASLWEDFNNGKFSLEQLVKKLGDYSGIVFDKRKDITFRYPEEDPSKKIVLKKRELDRVRKNARFDAFLLSSYFPLAILREELRFGPQKLQEFHADYVNLWDSMIEGYLDIEDIMTTLLEEVNISWEDEYHD